jgi:hypothetical protein
VNVEAMRRAVRLKGLASATAVPDASSGRLEEASIRPARLTEGPALRTIAFGSPECWPDGVAYLDGVQRSEIIGYAGSAPLLVAELAAAVRERRNRRLQTIVEARRTVVLARPAALAAAGEAVASLEAIPLPDTDPAHPLRDLLNAGEALDQARGALEIRVGCRYRAQRDGWLVVDGTLSVSRQWSEDARWSLFPRAIPFSRSRAPTSSSTSVCHAVTALPCLPLPREVLLRSEPGVFASGPGTARTCCTGSCESKWRPATAPRSRLTQSRVGSWPTELP